ncbi:IclR family transcriptional regulator [Pseudovibrio sp. Tun.PSC04-5.I4]|uniref:IclR family transcriptional regulator n=1 Tax=Pseudovibrio sp. Tun.PSC04-5.I4 TaxID=1798213 RepID=UPI00088611D7|nr:IclR family transcriptional regulator [Pseudovibrio sp. Tun.PSC04-5.I4]SDQ15842.1 DNA-binding transcriptional regulator, IclR family [Pseudovibrio sp. Tun.PSC04-5.I4]
MTERQNKLQKYAAPALEKGLDILEFLSLTDTRPTLSQLATGIGRSKNEIFRMVIVLEERGYIRREEGEYFALTDKLSAVAAKRSNNSKMVEIAGPFLSRLADETGMSNHMSVLEDNQFLVIASTPVSQNYGLSVQVGYRFDFFGTSAGLCFLSEFQRSQDRIALLSRNQPTLSIAAFSDYDQHVKNVQQDGYAVLPNPEAMSIREMSAPIRHVQTGSTIAAVTIPYFSTDENANSISKVAAHLLEEVGKLQEKIALTIPAIRMNNFRYAQND